MRLRLTYHSTNSGVLVSSTPSMIDIGVNMNPGATALTRMLYCPSSTAMDLVNAMMPPLEAL